MLTDIQSLCGRTCRWILIAAALYFSMAFRGFAWDGPTDDATWTQLKSDVEGKRLEIESLMSQANQAGLNTDYAFVSKVVIDLFLSYAQYDRSNPDKIVEAFGTFGYNGRLSADAHVDLPFDELQGCLEVAENAISELNKQLSSNIQLVGTVDFSTGQLQREGAYYRMEGKTVFPSKFTWMPHSEDIMQAFGRIGGMFYQATNLRDDRMVAPWAITNQVNDISWQSERNISPQIIFLGHAAAGWMKTDHPEILDGERNFTRYDTDSPLIREWLELLFEGMLPPVSTASAGRERIHLLANEPNFATRQGGWLANNGVSSLTKEKYREWLLAKYSTIENLNTTYSTNYENFESARAGLLLPISENLRGGPVWYDWCRFNMDRINDWFSFLKAGTQSRDVGGAPVTIKILGGQLSTSNRDDGMDMEFLAKLQDILGADLHTVPMTLENFNLKRTGWLEHYALDWVEQSMLLDFVKSISPDKPFYDSEWHGLSTGRWRDSAMDRDYVRAALWLAFSHGMSAINTWVWGREADGSPRLNAGGLYGDVLTQPSALDAYGRTLKELNAHSEVVSGFIPAERVFMIYYCEEAAIQSGNYIEEVEAAYEALKLLNLPTGFTTPTEIGSLDAASQVVIVPRTPHISDASLAALEGFGASNGKVVLVDGAESFRKTELGVERIGASGIVPYAVTEGGGAEVVADHFKGALASVMPEMPVAIEIMDEGGNPAYGVLAFQQSEGPGNGAKVLLINVSKDKRRVTMSVASEETVVFSNAKTQESIPADIMLEPYDVLLAEAPVQSDWEAFVAMFGLSGDSSSDFDADGKVDLYEFAFGGNPIVRDGGGMAPSIVWDESDGSLSLKSLEREGENSGVRYALEWAERLEGPWNSGSAGEAVGESDYEGFLEKRYFVDIANRESLFLRLRLSN